MPQNNPVTEFEYLSVLVSLVIGLSLSHLLAGTARLLQRRSEMRWHAPTLIWLALLFVIQVQIWWAAYESRTQVDWNFFAFLSFLAIPVLACLLCYLVVPDFERDDVPDLRAAFERNRPWFFGLLATIVVVSRARDLVEDGADAFDVDAAFRLAFIAVSLVASRVKSDRVQLVIALAMAALFLGYVVTLFLQLR